ncbi:MAG: hypothetical protein ACLTOX_02450 [Streptococcus thermophilus]
MIREMQGKQVVLSKDKQDLLNLARKIGDGMKLGKKCILKKPCGGWHYLMSGLGTFCPKTGEWYSTNDKEYYLTGKVPSTASVVKHLDKDTLVFMIVKMIRVKELGNSLIKF